MGEYVILSETSGKIHVIEVVNESKKYKGLGVFNSKKILSSLSIGDEVLIGQKYF